jgi:hypothetical protein
MPLLRLITKAQLSLSLTMLGSTYRCIKFLGHFYAPFLGCSGIPIHERIRMPCRCMFVSGWQAMGALVASGSYWLGDSP